MTDTNTQQTIQNLLKPNQTNRIAQHSKTDIKQRASNMKAPQKPERKDIKKITTDDFIKQFTQIGLSRHRYEVWRDFVTISAIAMHNAVNMNDDLENEYFGILGKYEKEDMTGFQALLGILVALLDSKPRDILGTLYMQLDLGNSRTGQYFTPPSMSQLMAELLYSSSLENLEEPFITLSDPCCGAGGMILGFVDTMLVTGHNPAEKLWVQCVDIDRVAALMCYVQLALWNVPAQIIVADTLSNDWSGSEMFYTPAHHMGSWDLRLNIRNAMILMRKSPSETRESDKPQLPSVETKPAPNGETLQFDFTF